MIFVRLYGGTGNQLFQIAYGLKLQKVYNQDICFDVSRGTNYSDKTRDYKMRSILESIDLKSDRIHILYNRSEFISLAGPKMIFADVLSILPRAVRKITRSNKLFCFLSEEIQIKYNKKGYYTSFDYYCNPEFKLENKNIYVSGLFSCKKYFDDIRDELVKLFYCKKMDYEHMNYMERIMSCNSVCVHIRKGRSYTNNKYLNVCSGEYFINSMEYLKKTLNSPVFFIFTNDYEWCEQNMNMEGFEYVFVLSNNDTDVLYDLSLMRSCKSFILSNSTLGWWAWYLCQMPDKVVVSPELWSKGRIKLLCDLKDDSWMTMRI